MRFPFPDRKEQDEIVFAINKLNDKINSSITIAKSEIEKAEEFQKSLITQVVTGQLNILN